MELKFQKHGWPQFRNTTTGELQKSGPLREQSTGTARIEMQQSLLLKTSQSQQSIVLYKASSMQSKHWNILPTWLLRETSNNTLLLISMFSQKYLYMSMWCSGVDDCSLSKRLIVSSNPPASFIYIFNYITTGRNPVKTMWNACENHVNTMGC